MSSQPYQARHSSPRDGTYVALANATPTVTSDDMSEKTVEMDMPVTSGSSNVNMGLLNQDLMDSDPYSSRQQRQTSINNVPSYMAPTQSAKAKVRIQGSMKPRGSYTPLWNPSTRRASVTGSGCDSSSSGGGTAAYHVPRSPSPMHNGLGFHGRRGVGCSPDSPMAVGDDWALPLRVHGWRHDFD